MKTTVRVKAAQVTKDWHVIDAADRPLGRLATEVAILLRGKHKPTFEPHLDGGDFVIVVNAAKVKVSGTKPQTKLYYRHSGYPGGLRSRTFEDQLERFPEQVIRQAVWGMLPKGSLGKAIINHLKVYAGPDHPHKSQVVSSERAQADRETAIVWTPPRLAPLPEPEVEAPVVVAPAEEVPAVEEAPKPRRRMRKTAASSETTAEDTAVPEADVEAEAEVPAVKEAPKPRRRTRKAALSSEVTTEDAGIAEVTEEEAPKPRRRRTRKATDAVADEAVTAEVTAPDAGEDAEKPKPKPKPKKRRTTKATSAAKAETSEEPAAEPEESVAPRRRTRRKKSEETS